MPSSEGYEIERFDSARQLSIACFQICEEHHHHEEREPANILSPDEIESLQPAEIIKWNPGAERRTAARSVARNMSRRSTTNTSPTRLARPARSTPSAPSSSTSQTTRVGTRARDADEGGALWIVLKDGSFFAAGYVECSLVIHE